MRAGSAKKQDFEGSRRQDFERVWETRCEYKGGNKAMAIDPKSITPAQRAQFLSFLQMLGGHEAVAAGLNALATLDSGKQLQVPASIPPGITIQRPPNLATTVPSGMSTLGITWGDVWKYGLKIIECGLKNIALALAGNWTGFAAAVLTCVFST
jgi:hypothetical protein